MTDNATSFTSGELKEWCRERGVVHLTRAPCHPATNGAAERFVETFKQVLKEVLKVSESCAAGVFDALSTYATAYRIFIKVIAGWVPNQV